MAEGSYASGTSTFPLMGMTIGEMVDTIAKKYPDTDAVVSMHQDIRWTYREFNERVNEVARGLMGMGVAKGDRVGIWAMNHAEWILVQFATSKIGAIMVNINPAYRTYELEYVLKQSEISTLFIQGRFKTSDYIGMFYEACPEAYEAKHGKISSEKFPFLKNVIYIGNTPYGGMFTWEDLQKRATEISHEELVERGESLTFDDPINIQYTSGTTGFPKGVVLTHHSILNNG
ncbi:MAG TPA: AMP-binding protein, partial [Methanoregula sp.]|nr:AMP-binding protein [Methanoregula sp.]